MAPRSFLCGVLVLAFSFEFLASGYSISETLIGDQFFDFFDIWSHPDPTLGRINYVDKDTAIRRGLVTTTSDSFIMRADHTTVLNPEGPGRDSVKIQSFKTYTQHVVVYDVRHMPEGCTYDFFFMTRKPKFLMVGGNFSTWPAIWEVGQNWPNDGEIDIVEGNNDLWSNTAYLHTGADCSMPERNQTGNSGPESNNCDSFQTNNSGCGVGFPTANSYGPAFNRNGGGWYALERSDHHYKIWFWARDDLSVPVEVRNGAGSVNPDSWGTPAAYYPDTQCDFPSHFGEHNLVINLTLCGTWASELYKQTKCPQDLTCDQFVNQHPEAFTNAYFDVASIRIYE